MSETKITFASLGIKDSILKVLSGLGLSTPTPIQAQAIPPALEGQDIIGIAQTGTGKTLAFGLPMLQRLSALKGRGLVVVPTRELASQVAQSIKKVGLPFGLKTAVLIGGEAIQKQLFLLRKNPHIVIATPGRLIDHLKRRTFSLDDVKTIVLDEADMMLDLGFAPQMEEILKLAPTDRQTMLFSATMPAAIAKLAAKYLKLPISIEVAPQGTTAETVDQEVIIVKGTDRFACLEDIIKKNKGSILVFVRTKHGVKEVVKKLAVSAHSVAEIHSNLSQSRRSKTLESFRSGRTRILVATDVASRGLDVKGIELVINYNLPDAHTDYVHRIGRTGRAGLNGRAISFATPDQLRDISAIEKLINKKLSISNNTYSVEPKVNPTNNAPRGRSNNSDYPRTRKPNTPNNAQRGLRTGERSNRNEDRRTRERSNRNEDRRVGNGQSKQRRFSNSNQGSSSANGSRPQYGRNNGGRKFNTNRSSNRER